MSVINQMLQDLEKRGETDDGHAGTRYIQAGVSASRTSPYKFMWVMIIVIAAIASIALWRLKKASPDVQLTSALAIPVTAPMLQDQNLSLHEQGLRLRLSTKVDTEGIVHKSKEGNITQTEPSKQMPPLAQTAGKPIAPIVTAKDSRSITPVSDGELRQNQTAVNDKSVAVPTLMIKEVSLQQRAESEFRQATIYQQQGRLNEAILALERSLQLDALHAPSRQLLISLLLESKRHEDAIRELKLGLNIEPTHLNFSMMLARLLLERAKLYEAIEILQKNLSLAQDRPDYLAFLAALQQKTGHHQEAIQLYRQAVKKQPQNGVWWMGLAISLQADGKSNEAIDAFQQAKLQSGLSAELHAFIDQRIAQLQK